VSTIVGKSSIHKLQYLMETTDGIIYSLVDLSPQSTTLCRGLQKDQFVLQDAAAHAH
jgi:hypothetical protein